MFVGYVLTFWCVETTHTCDSAVLQVQVRKNWNVDRGPK